MNHNVVLVDDDIDTVEIFQEYLKIKDINVVAVGFNGQDAVSLYSEHKPDVLLLDVMMPDYDGFYGLQNIKAKNPGAKIVMVTADKTAETQEKLTEMKADAILYKPYEIEEVIDTIKKVIAGEKLSPTIPESPTLVPNRC